MYLGGDGTARRLTRCVRASNPGQKLPSPHAKWCPRDLCQIWSSCSDVMVTAAADALA